jgi:steroid delta-isomerase-like uncharacterized protein
MKIMGDLEDQNKSIVRQFVEALNNRDLDSLDNLLAPDFVRYCQATPWVEIRSLDDFKRFLEDDWTGVPDAQYTVRFLVSEGDLVAFYCAYSGTQTGQWGPLPPSGRRIQFDYSGVFRFATGKIAELWLTWDNLAILTQVGYQLPVPKNVGG